MINRSARRSLLASSVPGHRPGDEEKGRQRERAVQHTIGLADDHRQRAVGRERSRRDGDEESGEVARIAERDAFVPGLHHFSEYLGVVVGRNRHARASQIGELHRQIEAG